MRHRRFERPRSGMIPGLPPYSAEIAEAARVLPTRVIPGCPDRGIRDALEPYDPTINQDVPTVGINRDGEKFTR